MNRNTIRSLLTHLISALLITAAAYLLSLLVYDITSMSIFSSLEKSVDFELSDVYNTVADRRAERHLSSDVVLVSVDECPRKRIAEVIDAIGFFGPAAVGLDIFFNYPGPDDDYLLEAIGSCSNLVLPVMVSDEGLQGSYFYALLDHPHLGAVNLGAGSVRDVVREFKPEFAAADGRRIGSLPAELVRAARPEIFAALEARRADTETIYYPSTDFTILTADEIISAEGVLQPLAQRQIEGKIILVGNIFDISDMHLTPLYSMSGLHIHAYTLQTILDGSYIPRTRAGLSWFYALAACFVVVLFGVWLRLLEPGSHGRLVRILKMSDSLWLRIVQFSILCLLLVVGCRWFFLSGAYADFSHALLLTGFATLAFDISTGLGLVKGVQTVMYKIIKPDKKP